MTQSIFSNLLAVLFVYLSSNFDYAHCSFLESKTNFTFPVFARVRSILEEKTLRVERKLQCLLECSSPACLLVHFESQTGKCSIVTAQNSTVTAISKFQFNLTTDAELWIVPDIWKTMMAYSENAAMKLNLVGKPSKQISTYNSQDASRGHDGNYNTLYSGGSCFHTAVDYGAKWWVVDTGTTFYLYKVVIFNRMDIGSTHKIRYISVGISDNPTAYTTADWSMYKECSDRLAPNAVISHTDPEIVFTCKFPLHVGQYVIVHKDVDANNFPLHFCEIDIYSLAA